MTPDPFQVCSKRSWDGQIRKWRRLLHKYDPQGHEYKEDPVAFEGGWYKQVYTTGYLHPSKLYLRNSPDSDDDTADPRPKGARACVWLCVRCVDLTESSPLVTDVAGPAE